MSLNATLLKNEILAVLPDPTASQPSREEFCQAIADAVIAHIQSNLEIWIPTDSVVNELEPEDLNSFEIPVEFS